MSVKSKIVFVILILLIGFFLGIVIYRFFDGPKRILDSFSSYIKIEKIKKERCIKDDILDTFRDQEADNFVFLILGQSNAANFGSVVFKAGEGVYNFYQGKVYKAHDPLLGADGIGGSIWSYFGQMLISSNFSDNVLLSSIAQGSSCVKDWADGGKQYSRLISTLEQLNDRKIRITHIVWLQGEEDNFIGTTGVDYFNSLNSVINNIRDHGINAPFYISPTTFHPLADPLINEEIRKAQMDCISTNSDVYLGPDTDLFIEAGDRHDGIHLSEKGMKKFATSFIQILKAERNE